MVSTTIHHYVRLLDQRTKNVLVSYLDADQQQRRPCLWTEWILQNEVAVNWQELNKILKEDKGRRETRKY